MCFLYLFVFYVLCSFLNCGFSNYLCFDCDSGSPISSSYHVECFTQILTQGNHYCKDEALKINKYTIDINCCDALRILMFSFGNFFLLWFLLLHLSAQVNYVIFNTNLNLYNKNKTVLVSSQTILTFLSTIILGLLLWECKTEQILLLTIRFYLNIGNNLLYLSLNKINVISRVASVTLLLYIFSISVTAATCILCLFMFQCWCYSYIKRIPHWLPVFLIVISNDIHLNPGPHYQNNFFNFMSWNLNSLAKDNFQRVRLIEAQNSIFNYDLISICETSLNDSVELPLTLLNDYTFVSANNPTNTRHGGVGLFYKNSLPVVVRHDLSFNKSIVLDLNFGRKKLFFIILYRSPANNHLSPEFQTFLLNFEKLYSKIKAENPLAKFFTGDFNAHSQLCVIYHIPSKQTQFGGVLNVLMEKAEKVQYQAALAITGAWQGSSRSKLYEDLGWESLSDRRWCRRILQVHKIVNNKTPFYLKKQTSSSS